MSTRFTETDKWKDPWFRKLSPDAKCLWQFLCDNCDAAGIWEVDLESASFHTGLTDKKIEAAMKGLARGYQGACGYLILRTFLRHQRNVPFNPSNNAHRPIIARLESMEHIFPGAIEALNEHGALPVQERSYEGACKGPIGSPSNSKGRSNGNSKAFTPPTPQEVEAYSREIGYPMNGAAWCDAYAQKGWMVGKNKMKDWKAAVRNWKSHGWRPDEKDAKGNTGKLVQSTLDVNDILKADRPREEG